MNPDIYFDRAGQPITFEEWQRRFADKTYQGLAATRTTTGAWVSTVWLGLDHGVGTGRPILFETMAFDTRGTPRQELACERYATEAEARAGHDRMVAKFGGSQEDR